MDDSDAARPGIPLAGQQDDAAAPGGCDCVSSVSHVEFAACYRAEMPYLIRYLMKCFADADAEDAADAAHSAFAVLLPEWDTVRSPRAWLRKVAFRQMLRQSPPADCPLDGNAPRGEPEYPAPGGYLDQREQQQAVLAAIRRLPLAQRQVFALVYDQFSYREIAEILGMAEPAVRKNAERARTRMKELLGIT